MIPQFCTVHPELRIKLKRITACISRTRYCLSINGPGKEVRWSLVRERAGDAKIMPKKKTQVKIVPFKLDELEKIQRREKSFHEVRYSMM